MLPGELNIVFTKDNVDDQYRNFNASSAAAPHVAGVAALLISYVNDHFNPNGLGADDVENLIQIYRTDVGTPGYDDENGWGRLNAGELMEHMEWPFFWVEHFSGSTTNYSTTEVASNVVLQLLEPMNGVAAGTYIGDVFEIDITVPHSIGNAQLLNSWVRNTSAVSNMYSNSAAIADVPHAQLVSATSTQAVIRGYIFQLEMTIGGSAINEWVPFEDGEAAQYGYSLHLHDENASSVEEITGTEFSELQVFPNPTDDIHTVVLPKANNMKVELVDMQGRVLRSIFEGSLESTLGMKVSLKGLPPGVYFYRLYSDTGTQHRKIVKN